MRKVRSLAKSFGRGQRGFTLIELLVVVAILGVLAAIAVPSVSVFIRDGKAEASETELHDVQLAVVAAMTATNSDTCVEVTPANATKDMDLLGVDVDGGGLDDGTVDCLASEYMVMLDTTTNSVKGEWYYSCTTAGIVTQHDAPVVP